MKKTLLIVLVMALCLGMTAIAMAGVSGTPHDPRIFSTGAGGPTVTHVCESCHTPHNAGTYPLWNRNRDGSTMTFTMYNSPTFDEKTGADYFTGGYMGYQSKLCFACHDGNTASIVNPPGQDVQADYDITILNLNKVLGSDLRKSHPVGFLVNLANDTGGSGLNALTFNASKINGSVNAPANWPLYPDPTGLNPTIGTFQCATCHTVHHTPDVAYSTTTEVYFLRIGNAASNMCKSCHPVYY
jgi:hypothetical protein